MMQAVQDDFQLLFKSYKQIKKLNKELGTETDSSSLRQKLQNELNSSETIMNRMKGDIARIDIKSKREKLQTQLSKTRIEIEDLRKDIEKEQRLNSVQQSNPFLKSDSTEENAWNNSNVGRPAEQAIEFQSFVVNQKEIEDREADIYKLQKETEQVAEVFQDFQELLNDQAPALDLLEANVKQAATNVELGAKEVDKAEELQKAKRKKMCMFLICLLVLAGLLAVILSINS